MNWQVNLTYYFDFHIFDWIQFGFQNRWILFIHRRINLFKTHTQYHFDSTFRTMIESVCFKSNFFKHFCFTLRPVTHYILFLNVFSGFHVFVIFYSTTYVGWKFYTLLEINFFATKVSNGKWCESPKTCSKKCIVCNGPKRRHWCIFSVNVIRYGTLNYRPLSYV